MTTILVTGGTRGLGVPTTAMLRAAGHDVRVLSRTSGPDRVRGDLDTGVGLDAALAGVGTVVHLATSRRKDIGQTRNLLAAAKRAGTEHLIFMSIVGVDKNPFPYFKDKVASERAIEESGVPYTILRATQFHSFIAMFFRLKLPVILAPSLKAQPIATEEAAQRLVELVAGGPAGRVPDIGGPEQLDASELARIWKKAMGSRKPILPVWIPGAAGKAYRAGAQLATLPGYGTITFADYAAAEAAAR